VESVGVLPLAEAVVIEVAAGLPDGFETAPLALARVESEDERPVHDKSIDVRNRKINGWKPEITRNPPDPCG
jgi:hypothetical protein